MKLKYQQVLLFILISVISFSTIHSVFAISGPRSPASPDVGLDGAVSMHGDIASSDTTPLPGPGSQDVDIQSRNFLSACPTILIRSDGKPFALCTSILGRNPVARLLKKRNGKQEAKLSLEAGSLLGGVYAYIDNQDRLVMVDGNKQLIRIKAEKKPFLWTSRWELSIDEKIPLAPEVERHCGESGCDTVVSINAGTNGTVWFVTQQSLVGVYDPYAKPGDLNIKSLKLADDERVDNSFSTTIDGRAAIVTNKALYVLKQDNANQPHILWRHEYDAGSARKPGQLSHGSGATPTFFGPHTGTDYVIITDNADNSISIIVRDAMDGKLICEQPIFTDEANFGSEDSAIGIGNTVIVASTYGYPYPAVPNGAGPSVPKRADFVGGMVRVDLNECDDDPLPCAPCDIVWENHVRSSAVPKLSTADDLIYTVERRPPFKGNMTTIFDTYFFTVIDSDTGNVLQQSKIGLSFFYDTLHMAGTVGYDGVFWQGTLGGVVRIAPQK